PGDRRPAAALHPAGTELPPQVGHPAGEPRPGGVPVGTAAGRAAPAGGGADQLRGLSQCLREAGDAGLRPGMAGGRFKDQLPRRSRAIPSQPHRRSPWRRSYESFSGDTRISRFMRLPMPSSPASQPGPDRLGGTTTRAIMLNKGAPLVGAGVISDSTDSM